MGKNSERNSLLSAVFSVGDTVVTPTGRLALIWYRNNIVVQLRYQDGELGYLTVDAARWMLKHAPKSALSLCTAT